MLPLKSLYWWNYNKLPNIPQYLSRVPLIVAFLRCWYYHAPKKIQRISIRSHLKGLFAGNLGVEDLGIEWGELPRSMKKEKDIANVPKR
jgi:hypothetical protein